MAAPHIQWEIYVFAGVDQDGVRNWAEHGYRMLSIKGLTVRSAMQGNVEGRLVDAMQEAYEKYGPWVQNGDEDMAWRRADQYH